MTRPLILLLALTAAAQAPRVSDRDKLQIREAELIVSEAQTALYRAQAQLQAILGDVGQRNACEIDPRTADCKAPPPNSEK